MLNLPINEGTVVYLRSIVNTANQRFGIVLNRTLTLNDLKAEIYLYQVCFGKKVTNVSEEELVVTTLLAKDLAVKDGKYVLISNKQLRSDIPILVSGFEHLIVAGTGLDLTESIEEEKLMQPNNVVQFSAAILKQFKNK